MVPAVRRSLSGPSSSSLKSDIPESSGTKTEQDQIPIPFHPQQKAILDDKFNQFMDIFCKVHTNLPLIESLQEIPKYATALKDTVVHKKRITRQEDVKMALHCTEIIQRSRSVKQRDPGQFIINCSIGENHAIKALCDLGASVNVMPLAYFKQLEIGSLMPTDIKLQMADSTVRYPVGIIEDVLVKVDNLIFPADFVVMKMCVDKNVPIILGRPFLATSKALIDVSRGEICLRGVSGKSTFRILSTLAALPSQSRERCEEVRVLTKLGPTTLWERKVWRKKADVHVNSSSPLSNEVPLQKSRAKKARPKKQVTMSKAVKKAEKLTDSSVTKTVESQTSNL